jgi:hypothetical protein
MDQTAIVILEKIHELDDNEYSLSMITVVKMQKDKLLTDNRHKKTGPQRSPVYLARTGFSVS